MNRSSHNATTRRSVLQIEHDNPSVYRHRAPLADVVGREEFLELVDDPYMDGEPDPWAKAKEHLTASPVQRTDAGRKPWTRQEMRDHLRDIVAARKAGENPDAV